MARLFTAASDEILVGLISSAKERLVLVAPGVSTTVAESLAARVLASDCPTELSVTLDTDPEVCRLGYGDISALKCIREALATRDRVLQTQSGLRIGLVVSDSDVLAYAPTPQLIEAGSTSDEKPNAIRIGGVTPQELAFACGAKDTTLLGLTQEVGLQQVTQEALVHAEANLKDNPPRRFDLVRLERVFNYQLEFVEFSVERFRLNTRVVPLPPIILGLAEQDLKDRLRNAFRIFEVGVPFAFEIPDPSTPDTTIKVTEDWIAREAKKLRDRYFIPLGSSYGNLMLKRLQPQFEAQLNRLRTLIDAYAEKVRDSMASKIAETRDSLVKALYPRIKAKPPEEWLERTVEGTLDDEALMLRLELEVDQAFGKVERTFKPIATWIFKGVRYETITGDPDFRKSIEEHFGEHEIAKLLSEYEASRAEDVATDLIAASLPGGPG